MIRSLRQQKLFLLLLCLAFIIRVVLLFYTYHGDVYNHIEWGMVALHHGLYGIYELPANFWHTSRINQAPLTVYLFLIVRFIYEQGLQLLWFLNNSVGIFPSRFFWFYQANFYPVLLKVPDVIADLGLGIVIYKFVRLYFDQKKAAIAAAIYLLNPVTIYNSALWGQTDAIINCFGILSFYFLVKRRLFWAFVALATSLLFKASLTIFIPVFLVLLYKQRYNFIACAKDVIGIVGFIFVITLPFHPLMDLLWFPKVYLGQVLFGTLGNVTENAFNFWSLFYGPTPRVVASTIIFGMRASVWGYAIFGAGLIATLVYFYRKMTIEALLFSLITTAFLAFLFLTGMHERYLFPILAPFTILVAFLPRLIYLYILVSFVHLTNLYYLWWVPRIEWYVQFLNHPQVVTGFAVSLHLMLLLFVLLYWRFQSSSTAHQIISSSK